MARKQSLTNKRRSQKNRNKKRARTIRSMRQVNGGVRLFGRSGIFGRRSGIFGRSGRSGIFGRTRVVPVLFEEVKQSSSEANVDSDNIEFIISSQTYNDQEFDDDLKQMLKLYVVDLNSTTDLKRNLELNDYIMDKKNTAVVVTPLKQIIQDDVIDEVFNYFTPDVFNRLNDETFNETLQKYTDYIQSLEDDADVITNSSELITSTDKLLLDLILFAKMKMMNNPEHLQSLYEDQEKFFLFAAMFTLNIIFGLNPEIVSPSTDPVIQTHLDSIEQIMKEEKAALSAGGGSKGKMRRPKSRTRKL